MDTYCNNMVLCYILWNFHAIQVKSSQDLLSLKLEDVVPPGAVFARTKLHRQTNIFIAPTM